MDPIITLYKARSIGHPSKGNSWVDQGAVFLEGASPVEGASLEAFPEEIALLADSLAVAAEGHVAAVTQAEAWAAALAASAAGASFRECS